MASPTAHPYAVDVRRCRANGHFSWSIKRQGKICGQSMAGYESFEEARREMKVALTALIAALDPAR
ncbi:hypothetical protein [Methylobacterium sp. Leaf118]|uniref:hypothetical protein n=1 Tax=Methylobacterium sp. Leaf118 TaxID=2876562 RepID=UPI001E5A76D9|nr:hypothetical protein [Methylobacterium sp. Leaf118]